MLPFGGKIFLLLLIGVTLYLFGRRARFLIRLLKLGKSENRSDHLGKRLRATLGQVLAERCTLKNVSKGDYAGVGHLLLFYGFSLFLISYVFDIAEGFYEKLSPAIFGVAFNNLFLLFLDIAGLIVIAVIIWAAIRRYIIRPDRLEPTLEAGIILMVVFFLMLLNYGMEGFGLLAQTRPFADWSFVGTAFSHFFVDLGLKENSRIFFWTFWWFHIMVIFAFGIYVLYSKHLHILASHFNLFFHPTGPKGSLQPIRHLEKAEGLGVSKITEFSWKHLLDLYACTECGRCTANCPASISGKPLKPRDIIHNLKIHLLTSGSDLLSKKHQGVQNRVLEQRIMVGRVVTQDELWACTTCHACVEVCPVEIEHVERIVNFRRHLVMQEANFPSEVKSLFRNLETYGDTYGRGPSFRIDWATGLPVKMAKEDSDSGILYWAGCEGSFHDRNKEVSKVIVKMIQEAGVSVRILGKEEECCGDPARRIGNEYLFQELARRNIEILNRYGVRKIITYCPHCYHTLKNEYPLFGGHFVVLHYSEYLAELLRQGRLKIKRLVERVVTLQDPCYLGRINGVYDAPREILQSIPGVELKEMNRSREKSLCCGGGGGRMWMHEHLGQRINNLRVREAIKTGAEVVATGCPYCLTMFEDGMKNQDQENRVTSQNLVLDLSQILYSSII
jgi:Fe-S oxidoreductase